MIDKHIRASGRRNTEKRKGVLPHSHTFDQMMPIKEITVKPLNSVEKIDEAETQKEQQNSVQKKFEGRKRIRPNLGKLSHMKTIELGNLN